MLGIAIPPFDLSNPAADGIVWPGIVAAVLLAAALAASAWVYIRSRPRIREQHRGDFDLPDAA